MSVATGAQVESQIKASRSRLILNLSNNPRDRIPAVRMLRLVSINMMIPVKVVRSPTWRGVSVNPTFDSFLTTALTPPEVLIYSIKARYSKLKSKNLEFEGLLKTANIRTRSCMKATTGLKEAIIHSERKRAASKEITTSFRHNAITMAITGGSITLQSNIKRKSSF